ncbi:MAG: sialate O-acetylesterase, partial [Opitutaceae bacterium]
MRVPLFSILLPCLSVCVGTMRADVTLAPLFTDHAVLQRDKPVPVWGRGDVGEKVTVTFLNQQVGASTGFDGVWRVTLAPLETQTNGSEMKITGKNTLVLQDIVVGEVWICGGGSNMHLPLVAETGAGDLIVQARYPLIRQIRIEEKGNAAPSDSAQMGNWQRALAPAAGEFSAVGISFAREIFQKTGVPIGLINTTTKDALTESWLSSSAFVGSPTFANATNPAAPTLEVLVPPRAGERPGKQAPSSGAINPLLPYALRGILWQEGFIDPARVEGYPTLFAALVSTWRAHFGQGDFPVYWVQAPNQRMRDNSRGTRLAAFREAQTRGLALPETGQVVAIDLDGEDRDLTVQQTIGRRLALLAKNRIYGIVADDSGPLFVSAVTEGAAMRVRLAHANNGLVAHDQPVQSVELAGPDKVFRAASVKIERDTLLVRSPEVRTPVAVRYAWRNDPEANLYNGAGLPAAPFRSD